MIATGERSEQRVIGRAAGAGRHQDVLRVLAVDSYLDSAHRGDVARCTIVTWISSTT